MMSRRYFTANIRGVKWLAGSACIAVLQGCSTPQPLLDQANHGAALTMSLQAELTRFRAVQGEIAQQRLDSIRRQLTSMATYQIDADFDQRVQKAAGTATNAQLFTDLRTLADSRAADEKLLTQQLTQIDVELAKVLVALPDTAKALDVTQKNLALMGEELSTSDRLNTAADFAKEIKAGIDENRKRIDAAKAATSSASVQPPAPLPGT